MTIRRLLPQHAAAYRELMLEAYAAHPEAFTSSVAERAALPLSWWETRLSDAAFPAEAVFGASEGGILSGVAGLAFERREKTRHKATLFGMYVSRAYRGQGLGQQLVTAALNYARARTGIRELREIPDCIVAESRHTTLRFRLPHAAIERIVAE